MKVWELLSTIRRIRGKHENKVELSHGLVRCIVPIAGRLFLLAGDCAPLFTPYSVYTLHTNGCFFHEKASRLLGYRPSGLVESIDAL